MKPQLKPGCLAMVVGKGKTKSTRSNAGKVVTCLKYVGTVTTPKLAPNDLWLIDRDLTFGSLKTGEYTGSHPYCPASRLVPITDPDQDVDVTTDQPMKEKDHV